MQKMLSKITNTPLTGDNICRQLISKDVSEAINTRKIS